MSRSPTGSGESRKHTPGLFWWGFFSPTRSHYFYCSLRKKERRGEPRARRATSCSLTAVFPPCVLAPSAVPCPTVPIRLCACQQSPLLPSLLSAAIFALFLCKPLLTRWRQGQSTETGRGEHPRQIRPRRLHTRTPSGVQYTLTGVCDICKHTNARAGGAGRGGGEGGDPLAVRWQRSTRVQP